MQAISEKIGMSSSKTETEGRANDWTPREACALCDSQRGRIERVIGGFPIRRCADCGFCQTGKVLSPEALARFYSIGYGGLRQKQGQEINAQINMDAMRRMGLLDHSINSIVDIGCGYGFLLKRLAGHACRLGGVELASAEVDYARDVLGLDVSDDFDGLSADLQDGLDMIVLFEVLEHIAEPLGFLRSLAARLKPGGVLVIGTDNFTSWPVRVMGDHFPKWIPHQHISLFDPASLSAVIDRISGMEIIARASYTPWEQVARGLVYRGTGRRVGKRVFDLESELVSENSRPFRLFGLRRMFNRFWFAAVMRRDLSGEMMFIAARKQG